MPHLFAQVNIFFLYFYFDAFALNEIEVLVCCEVRRLTDMKIIGFVSILFLLFYSEYFDPFCFIYTKKIVPNIKEAIADIKCISPVLPPIKFFITIYIY
jgi:hypothetical protein